MSHSAAGRHRAPASDDRTRRGPLVVGVTLLAVLVLGGVGWWLSTRDGSAARDGSTASNGASTTSTAGSTASPTSPEPSMPAVVVESQRRVTVDGAIVTVEETSTVVAGSSIKAEPAKTAPAGLRLLSASLQSPDGRASSFNNPVELRSSGSLTTSARYRLTDCPDVLPVVWPSPTEFPGATQTYTRLEEPLHTAYAICPEQQTQASTTSGITGELVPGDAVAIKLSWDGGDTLTVAGIGSASGVAALVVQSAPPCGPDPSCLAVLDAVTSSGETSTATFTLQPVDPCPPKTESDTLVLLVTGGSSPPEPAAIEVDGLHRVICR